LKVAKSILFILCLLVFQNRISAANLKYTFVFENSKQSNSKGKFYIDSNTVYGQGQSYGLDLGTKANSGQPFFFSADLPEGNYLVTVVLGSKNGPSQTTVKAESRRLMLENRKTEKGEFCKYTFVVNIRNSKIGVKDSVKLKPLEIGKLIWDNKLTLEFNGENPSVVSIQIEKADNLLTLFLAGDSTVVDESDEPWTGWGQMLTRFLTPQMAVANYAESGEAANTFVAAKRFAKLLSKMKKGDYLFIQFGHNDEKQKGEGKGPFTSYKQNLKFLIDEARKRGGIPVLITSMNRRTFDKEGRMTNSHGDYPDAVRQLAQEAHVPLIDLNRMSKTLYEAWGNEGSKKAFVHFPKGTFPNQTADLADNTHFNPYGGYELAKCIVQGIIDANLPIKKYIVKDFKGFDPNSPDKFDRIRIPQTPFSSTLKPDGN
jgi:lysophospholipase L1-like esterase